MKRAWNIALGFALCVILIALADLELKQTQYMDRLNDKPQVTVEEPQMITGRWQIILYNSRIFPPKVIKTSSYYVKDKVIWYKDEVTQDELPMPDGGMLIPDDGRDLETYGVYDVETYNAAFD
jgi:hypothetical protein